MGKAETSLLACQHAPSLAAQRHLRRGEIIHQAGCAGSTWRVISGSLRLDVPGDSGAVFAGLALRDDIIGVETLTREHCAFTVSALSDCVLEPWSAYTSHHELQQILARNALRAAAMMEVRSGLSTSRVRNLIRLIDSAAQPDAADAPQALPDQCAMAEITGLTHETVCRVIAQMRKDGELKRASSGKKRFIVQLKPESAGATC
jgi:CRP-like cAMP-binding protein